MRLSNYPDDMTYGAGSPYAQEQKEDSSCEMCDESKYSEELIKYNGQRVCAGCLGEHIADHLDAPRTGLLTVSLDENTGILTLTMRVK